MALKFTISDEKDFVVMPWKNGKGTTTQFAIHPPGSSIADNSFVWRLSSATMSESGPFSSYPQYTRILIHTEGSPTLHLHMKVVPDAFFDVNRVPRDYRFIVNKLAPYTFSGRNETYCEMKGE